MAVGQGAAAGREGDAVAAQEKLARGQGGEWRGQFFARGHAGRSGSGRRSKVETPAGRAFLARDQRRRAFAVPGLAGVQRAPRNGRAAVHEEDHARRRRQRERSAVRQHIFVKREHGRHGAALLNLSPFVPAPAFAGVNSSGDPGFAIIDWIPAFAGMSGGETRPERIIRQWECESIPSGKPLGGTFRSSLPGLTRQSIHVRKDLLARKMDARVKPAHDGLGKLTPTAKPGTEH